MSKESFQSQFLALRLLHDLIGPIGGTRALLDLCTLETNKEKEIITDITKSLDSLIAYLDLLRRAFAYLPENMDQKQLEIVAKNCFGEKITIGKIDGKWHEIVLLAMAWLKYKVLKNSAIKINQTGSTLKLELREIYLTDEEEEIFSEKFDNLDSHNIYLFLFLEKAKKTGKVDISQTAQEYLVSVE